MRILRTTLTSLLILSLSLVGLPDGPPASSQGWSVPKAEVRWGWRISELYSGWKSIGSR